MEMKTNVPKRSIFPRQIAFNALAQIPQKDAFLPNGYTTEEMKMIEETKKIMGDPDIKVSPTCVRVTVKNSHSRPRSGWAAEESLSVLRSSTSASLR